MRETAIFMAIAEAPMMTSVLKMLLPTMFPTLMSPLPRMLLKRLTINSGRLVPIATMVRPMTSSLTFQRRATPQAPSVNLSAPQSTRAVPTRSNTIFINMITDRFRKTAAKIRIY